MPLEDKEMRLRVTREIAKFNIDASRIDVKVINQIVYLGGWISRMRTPGAPRDIKKVLEQIIDDLSKTPGITDIVSDVKIR
jgi:osmotically-inducible protein OsmY